VRRRRTGGSLARGDPEAFAAALARASAALSATPAGLLTDLDGTLAPIVATPDMVRPEAGAMEALDALAAQLAVVGVITGRAATDARRLLGNPTSLLIIGNHGLEWLEPGAQAPIDHSSLAVARRAVADAVGAVPAGEGVAIEDKGLSATIHYRGAADPGAARERVMAALAAAKPIGLEVREGRMSVELRPVGLGDKGTAVRRVVERFALRGLVVGGDDVTDLDMFEAATALEASAGLRVTRLAVAGGREVPPGVAAAADVVLPDPADFARVLRALVSGPHIDALPGKGADGSYDTR
jgi:trehalose 6-phosphate phosphatase